MRIDLEEKQEADRKLRAKEREDKRSKRLRKVAITLDIILIVLILVAGYTWYSQPNLFRTANEQWWVDEDTLCETRVSPSDPEFRELLCVWMKEDEE